MLGVLEQFDQGLQRGSNNQFLFKILSVLRFGTLLRLLEDTRYQSSLFLGFPFVRRQNSSTQRGTRQWNLCKFHDASYRTGNSALGLNAIKGGGDQVTLLVITRNQGNVLS